MKQLGVLQGLAAAALCALAPVSFAQPGSPPPPPPGPSAQPGLSREQQLENARRRLEEAAREVAELSMQEPPGELGAPRAIIGVVLEHDGRTDGAYVMRVSPGGPAAEGGMRAGDVIVAINGTDVRGDDSARRVVQIMREVKPDAKVALQVMRDGKPLALTVTARAAPDYGFGYGFGFPLPPIPPLPPGPPGALFGRPPYFMQMGALADMELATLSPQLGHYFGTDQGVLVVRASGGGALKLEDGDVILSIDGRVPQSGAHAIRILSSYQPGEKITLRILRDHRTLTLVTRMPGQISGRASGPAGPMRLPPQGAGRGGPGAAGPEGPGGGRAQSL